MDNNKGFSVNLPQVCSLTGTMAITAMSAGANGKNKTMMNGDPLSWSRMNPPGNPEKIG